MQPVSKSCDARLESDSAGWRQLVLENDLLKVIILPDKGADIYQLLHKPMNLDVLWKTPWGRKHASGVGVPSSFTSDSAWLEVYPGGWQEIFPNGGISCTYKGAQLGFHGEASMTTWDFEIPLRRGGDAAEIILTTRLARSPFRMHRVMRVEAGRPMLTLSERITNEGDEPMDYMWGHHPAFGAPFISDACRIDVGARTFMADEDYATPNNPATPGGRFAWPNVERDGKPADLSRLPSRSQPRDLYGFLLDFEAGWYGITNTEMGLGVGMTWPLDVFPCAWLWQELGGSSGYPWYRVAYTVAIEPFTSYPGRGVTGAIERGTQKVLQPGATVSAEIGFVFYASKRGIRGINADGSVVER